MPNKSALRLLPNYFKKVGLVLIALTALIFALIVIIRPAVAQSSKDLVKVVLMSLVILAMALIVLSREKIEDELVQALRLRAMAFAFISSVVHTIVYPFSLMLVDGTLEKADSYEVIFTMLIVYLLIFSNMKKYG